MERHDCEKVDLERLVTLKEIVKLLADLFGLSVIDHVIRRRLETFLIDPVCWGPDRRTGRGTLPYFDPLAVWVLAVALLTDAKAAVLRMAFMDAHRTFSVAGTGREAAVRAAHYAFITNPGIGLDVPRLDRIVREHPEVLDLSSDGRPVLEQALRVYKAQKIEDATGVPVDVDKVVLGEKSKKSNDRHFAELVALLQEQGFVDPDINPAEHHPMVGNARVHFGWKE